MGLQQVSGWVIKSPPSHPKKLLNQPLFLWHSMLPFIHPFIKRKWFHCPHFLKICLPPCDRRFFDVFPSLEVKLLDSFVFLRIFFSSLCIIILALRSSQGVSGFVTGRTGHPPTRDFTHGRVQNARDRRCCDPCSIKAIKALG